MGLTKEGEERTRENAELEAEVQRLEAKLQRWQLGGCVWSSYGGPTNLSCTFKGYCSE